MVGVDIVLCVVCCLLSICILGREDCMVGGCCRLAVDEDVDDAAE